MKHSVVELGRIMAEATGAEGPWVPSTRVLRDGEFDVHCGHWAVYAYNTEGVVFYDDHKHIDLTVDLGRDGIAQAARIAVVMVQAASVLDVDDPVH